MKKIPTLYQRDLQTGLVTDVLSSPNLAWIQAGEGRPTVKLDGTCCRVTDDGLLWKRYDRKPMKKWRKAGRAEEFRFRPEHARESPNGWEPCEPDPDPFTGHWPGWLPVDGQEPADKWHMEALAKGPFTEATYELIGPKVQGNPYRLDSHRLVPHGSEPSGLTRRSLGTFFSDLRQYLETAGQEGIVWWWGDSPKAKVKSADFGIDWKEHLRARE